MIPRLIPAGPVYTVEDMLEGLDFRHHKAAIEVETEGHGTLKMQNAFPRLSKMQSGVRRTTLFTAGQHNFEVMSELFGWVETDLAAKAEQGLK